MDACYYTSAHTIERSAPRVSPGVNCGLWLVIMCLCRFISRNQWATLAGDVEMLIMGESVHEYSQGVCGKSLYLHLNVCVNLKLLYKAKVFKNASSDIRPSLGDTHPLDPTGHGQYVIGIPPQTIHVAGASTSPAPKWPRLLPPSLKDHTYVTAPWEGSPPVQTLLIPSGPRTRSWSIFFMMTSSALAMTCLCPTKLYVEALTPRVMVLGGGFLGSD